jgi:hypothetical protein
MTNLSPAAQAVLNGFKAVPDLRDGPSMAGALRAVADQVVPCIWFDSGPDAWLRDEIRQQLLAIAAELEAQ